jgi:hypothetical protein
MVYWLVMFTMASQNTPATGSFMLHVGNYPTMQDCMSAAKSVQYFPPRGDYAPGYACIQANAGGNTAPN